MYHPDPNKIVAQLEMDISWDQDDLVDSEQDVFNTETEPQDEAEGLVY
jgi:hypothetical protein